jgi:hypothetical protein
MPASRINSSSNSRDYFDYYVIQTCYNFDSTTFMVSIRELTRPQAPSVRKVIQCGARAAHRQTWGIER